MVGYKRSARVQAVGPTPASRRAFDLTVRVIGIDCATDPKRVGYAFARFSGMHTILEQAALDSATRSPTAAIADWLDEGDAPALLALDAPLGWPAPLSEALHNHRARQLLPGASNTLFRRDSDRVVRVRIGKQSLDVGADRIARTAHAALQLLRELRSRLGKPIPLAWSTPVSGTNPVEVYSV